MVNLNASFKGDISQMLSKMKKELKDVPKEAYQFFVKQTPVAKKNGGNARRNTKLKGNTIQANYQYAEVLDKGRHMTSRGMRGSEQAPEGMTKPTEEFIQQRVDKIVKGK
jgi:hypothetical protein